MDKIGMTSISFNPNKMEFLISFISGDIPGDKEQETLNLGQVASLQWLRSWNCIVDNGSPPALLSLK